MSRRYLYGPVTPRFVDQNLYRVYQARDCLAFNADGSAGLAIRWGDTWQTIAARWPDGWQPDFVVLDLHYTSIQPCLERSEAMT
jgi:hypothetical protein